MRRFKDKSVLITGVAGNLGTALARSFGQQGAKIIGFDRDKEQLEQLRKILLQEGITIQTFDCDLLNSKAWETKLQEVKTNFGPIDVLINNAGITHIKRLEALKAAEQTLRKVMEVNLFAAAKATEILLPDLIQQQGLIINISSVAGFAPLVGRTAYAASKHALHGYFESLRNELHPHGVGCLMVCPSFIQAPDNFQPNEHSIYQKKKTLGKTIPATIVAKRIVQAAIQNRPRLIIGQAAVLSYRIRRWFPNIYERLMRKKLSKEI